MSEGQEATRRNFLRTVTAITVNPLSPDISGLSELEDALGESEVSEVDPNGYTELIEDEDSIGLIYVPGESYYNNGFWMWKDRERIEKGSPWAILEEFDRGINPDINDAFTKSFGSQEAFLSHFFESADELENEAVYAASLNPNYSPKGIVPESGSSRHNIIQGLDGDFPQPNESEWGWIHGDRFDLYLDNKKEKAIVFPHLSEAHETVENALETYREIPDFMDKSLPYANSISDYLQMDFERDEEVLIRLASMDYEFEAY